MSDRSNVSPVPLPVAHDDRGIVIEYLDGRRVTYRAPVTSTDGSVRGTVTREIHVLIVDQSSDDGIMVYINDYDTDDAVLETSGVGRVILADGEEEAIFPGVRVSRVREHVDVRVDEQLSDVDVVVFVEDDRGEQAYRLSGTS